MERRSSIIATLALALLALVISVPVGAATATSSSAMLGPRVGFSSSPDQLVVGGQVEFPEFAPHLTVDPSLELGFFDDQTTIALNGDFYYHFPLRNSAWTPYAGLGVALVISQFANSDSQTDAGANLVGGASVPTRSGNRFFGELRIGLGDIPSLKLIAGWNFKV